MPVLGKVKVVAAVGNDMVSVRRRVLERQLTALGFVWNGFNATQGENAQIDQIG